MTSLRGRLMVRLVVGLVLALVLGGGALWLFLRQRLSLQFDEALVEKARILASSVVIEDDGRLEMELAEFNVPELGRVSPSAYFEVRSQETSLFMSESLQGKSLAVDRRAGPKPALWNQTLPDGRAGRGVTFTFVPLPEHPEAHGPSTAPPIEIVLLRERVSLDARVREMGLALGLLGIFLLVAMPLVVANVVPRGLLPLDELGRAVAAIDSATLGRHFPETGLPRELEAIVRQLNQLMDRLKDSFDRETRFSADVAHELRSPIAELRALAEVALAGPAEPRARQAFLDARDIAVQMEGLVTGLLALARCESGQQSVSAEETDVGALVNRVWGLHAAEAARKALRVSGLPVRGATAHVDRVLVETVMTNLIANAVFHTPEAGAVTVELTAGASLLVAVSNTDTTLSGEDLRHVFERLWRKDAARSDGTHSGLGLSIAAALVARMGGTLVAERLSPDTVRFTMSLPQTDLRKEVA